MELTDLQLEGMYRLYGPALLRYLKSRLSDSASAEDLLHETFMQALRRAQRVEEVDSPRAWLFGIARHLVGDWFRRRQPMEPLPDGQPAAAPVEPDPRLEWMRRAVLELSPALRETLELRLRDELNYEEIAQVLDIPVGTVRSRLHHAVRQLRERLDKAPSAQE